MDRKRTGVVFVLLSASGFGTLAVLGKYAFAAGMSTPTALFLRFGIGTVVYWLLLSIREALRWQGGASENATSTSRFVLSGRQLKISVMLGFFGFTTQSALFFWGLEFMTAGMATVVVYVYPVFLVVVSAVLLGETVTRTTIVAIPVALAGIALITGSDPAGVEVVGIVLVLGSAFVYAVYTAVSRRALDSVDATVLAAYVLPGAAIGFVLIGAATGGLTLPSGPNEWAIAVALGIFPTAVPVLAFFEGLSRIGANRTGVLSMFEPVVAVVLGVALLDESLTPISVVGGGFVIAGVYMVQAEARKSDTTDP